MATKLTCGILGGVFVGGVLASVAGHPETLIPVFMAAGAGAAGIWHYVERQD